ncbi:MAG: FliI/YscN family ATPase [Oscillospiraceae bacterium]|jgi:flagellum-specific ATP synthase|nr:FliI/YscN family ATPase [Oscillospiraceae bacterium]
MIDVNIARNKIAALDTRRYTGRVVKIVGLAVEATAPSARIGDIVTIHRPRGDKPVEAEIVGFRDGLAQLMPYGALDGAGLGCAVRYTDRTLMIPVGEAFLGRVLNALGQPMDDGGVPDPSAHYPADSEPRNPLKRDRIHDAMPLGVRAIDGTLTVGVGQRIGIFAGSGVGKSTLLGMMARRASADVNVIVLIGERGREVLDFVERDLGEGLAKSVLIVATSDQPALLRLKSALVGTAMAEYFRDQGKNVLLMMDSLTRFAMAQREIGMAGGEPPVSRGYPPSVYTMMPRLLERAGTSDKGSITGIYTVLVEGDDLNEPVADTARGILDGHIVLSRQIANTRYPPIDVLGSVSRVMPDVVTEEHMEAAREMRSMIATYGEAEDLINIGAYKEGANADIDRAVRLRPKITEFLRQGATEEAAFDDTLTRLQQIAGE